MKRAPLFNYFFLCTTLGSKEWSRVARGPVGSSGCELNLEFYTPDGSWKREIWTRNEGGSHTRRGPGYGKRYPKHASALRAMRTLAQAGRGA